MFSGVLDHGKRIFVGGNGWSREGCGESSFLCGFVDSLRCCVKKKRYFLLELKTRAE